MLWPIVIILFMLWLLGLAIPGTGNIVHLLLVVVLVIVIYQLVAGRRTP